MEDLAIQVRRFMKSFMGLCPPWDFAQPGAESCIGNKPQHSTYGDRGEDDLSSIIDYKLGSKLLALVVIGVHKRFLVFLFEDLFRAGWALVTIAVKIDHVAGGSAFHLRIVARQRALANRRKFHMAITLGGILFLYDSVLSEYAAGQRADQHHCRYRCANFYSFHNSLSFEFFFALLFFV